MDINTLTQLYELCKQMKSEYIYIQNDTVYGADVDFVFMKVMRINPTNIIISFSLSSLAKFIKEVGLDEIVIRIDNLGNKYLYSSHTNFIEIDNIVLTSKLENMKYSILHTILYSDPIVNNIELRGNEQFENILALKTAEGSKRFVFTSREKNYVMTLFNNLLPVNKSDKVYLDIYDIDVFRFISKFTICKKKNVIIDVYVMYMFI